MNICRMESSTEIFPTLAAEYTDTIIAGSGDEAWGVVEKARELGASAEEIYMQIFCPSQIEVGERWHRGDISIADEHRATEITLARMEQLKNLTRPVVKTGYCAVITAVEGEIHFIGAKMFADFLYFEGWDVHFLGANLPLPDLIDFVKKLNPHLVGLSLNAVETVPRTKEAVRLLKELSPTPKIFLGGAMARSHFELLTDIGADGVMRDGNEAIEMVRSLVGIGDPTTALESFLKELGTRIHTLRKARSMSQQQLADAADLDRTYISAVEHGKQNVTIGAIVKLSNALKVPLRQLLVG